MNTADAHIVALDARTGEVAFDHTVADKTLGYMYTSGPIVVEGNIVAGMSGCERFKDDVCFISAHDADTGDEVWRTATIARPGDPGGDTWGDLPLRHRAGVDSWIPGSYDPATGLIYWSTSQAKPWSRVTRGTDVLWEIDRTTGEFVAAHDLGYQTVIDVDPQTGQVPTGPA